MYIVLPFLGVIVTQTQHSLSSHAQNTDPGVFSELQILLDTSYHSKPKHASFFFLLASQYSDGHEEATAAADFPPAKLLIYVCSGHWLSMYQRYLCDGM